MSDIDWYSIDDLYTVKKFKIQEHKIQGMKEHESRTFFVHNVYVDLWTVTFQNLR